MSMDIPKMQKITMYIESKKDAEQIMAVLKEIRTYGAPLPARINLCDVKDKDFLLRWVEVSESQMAFVKNIVDKMTTSIVDGKIVEKGLPVDFNTSSFDPIANIPVNEKSLGGSFSDYAMKIWRRNK